MQKKKLTWWIAATLVLMLFALTGCQTIQGLDVTQAIQNNALVQSAESKGSLRLELVPNHTSALTAGDKAILEVLKDVKLELNNVSMQDKRIISVDGALTYSKGSIPFQASLNETKFALQIEGAKKQIFFDLAKAQGGSFPTELTSSVQKQLMDTRDVLAPALTKFIITNAPNPKQISVSSVSEQVYSETLSLQKLHVEIKGSDLVQLLKEFLTSILADEKGMKELLGQLYDVLVPIIKEQMKASDEDEDDEFSSPFPDLMRAYLDNKTLAVEFAFTTIQQGLQKWLKDWDTTVASAISSSKDPQAQAFLSDKTVLKTDLFVDSDKQIRKVRAELSFPITDASTGISEVKLTYVNDIWNINKPVKAHLITPASDAVDLIEAKAESTSILSFFKKDSQAYSFLRNDLQVAKREVHLMMSPSEDDNSSYDASHPYINADNVSMLPVRFITDRLGAEVKWNKETKQITVTDTLTEKTIILELNSQSAQVNGVAVALDSAPVLKNGATFVPLRFIAEQLGCKIEFDNNTHSVTLTRH
ncbi:copper amine oxidase N-terminal domain-containing protein [Paenibacillus alba]|uniref:Copper amine oxidase N-terminal domain-containing protein n=1 Tax=Paenibacillus alba TaxID=1197127 RepID=A0ABU6FVP6_9BACL|nr:copper amine oxidase N-terminal domain-containing protein [Paenibacillus alba]MEC0225952.1 copper amine oxidase N-terminal domain-containing protein [Paenibacillus alba]